jgi:CcmD family protein
MIRPEDGRPRLAALVPATVVFLALGAASPAGAAADIGAEARMTIALQQPAAQDEFVPVAELPPDERLPAAPLLVGAYAFAWVMVLGYLWSIWRRLSAVEREIAQVARQVETVRRS